MPLATSNRLPISVCLISGAEEKRIGDALESVARWTTEIIVVLNQDVHDRTEEIAIRQGAKVYREPWKGHVAQKNSAANKARQDWILGLDTDEVVSAELRQEIHELFAKPAKLKAFAGFSFPRRTWFCGRWIRHGDWYPDRGTRLWRRDRGEWAGVDPHDKLTVQGRIGRLRSDLLHYNANALDGQLAKIGPYSDAFVRDALRHRRQATWIDFGLRPAWRFLRAYFLRLGFLDGWQGYYIAWMGAFHSVTRYAKLREAATQRTSDISAPHRRGN